MDEINSLPRAAPRWRRIVDFPLMAMLLSIVALAIVGILFNVVGKAVFPVDKSDFGKIWHMALGLVLLVTTLRFTNARLGTVRRNEFPAATALRGVLMGLIIGTLLYSIVVGEAALAQIYRVIGMGDASQFWRALVLTAIAPGIIEEIFFRGVLQRWLEELGGTAFGLIASSVLFGLSHAANPGVTPLAIIVIIGAGFWLGTAYKLSGSLWYPIALHAAWNFAQGEIWDVPVSGMPAHGLLQAKLAGPAMLTGGEFGLESSLFALFVMIIVSLWQTVRVYRRGTTMPNWWARRRAERSEEAVGIDIDRDAGLGLPVEAA